jgi:hypothetical protein
MDFTGIVEMRGRAYKKVLIYITANIILTLHPAAALYNPKSSFFWKRIFQRMPCTLVFVGTVRSALKQQRCVAAGNSSESSIVWVSHVARFSRLMLLPKARFLLCSEAL